MEFLKRMGINTIDFKESPLRVREKHRQPEKKARPDYLFEKSS